MKEEIETKIKYACFLSIIGAIISFGFLLFEIITKGNSIIFWTILLVCNLVVLVYSYTEYKNE